MKNSQTEIDSAWRIGDVCTLWHTNGTVYNVVELGNVDPCAGLMLNVKALFNIFQNDPEDGTRVCVGRECKRLLTFDVENELSKLELFIDEMQVVQRTIDDNVWHIGDLCIGPFDDETIHRITCIDKNVGWLMPAYELCSIHNAKNLPTQTKMLLNDSLYKRVSIVHLEAYRANLEKLKCK